MRTHSAADKRGSDKLDINLSLPPFPSLRGGGVHAMENFLRKAVMLLLTYTWPMHIHVHM